MPKFYPRRLHKPVLPLYAIFILVLSLVASFPIRGYAYPILRYGSQGESVSLLQEKLTALGFDPGTVDGIFGPRTLSAVEGFQSSQGLYVDGIVGPITWGSIERATTTSRGGQKTLSGKTIVLDPGHGGPEPGAISYWGDKEKNFTLPIVFKVQKYLEGFGANVVLTRYGDYTPGSDWAPPADDLLARVSIANSRGADMFVSVHINSYPQDPYVSGVMGFYRQGSWQSSVLAKTLALSVAKSAGLTYIDTQVGPYYVLNHTYMPAALVEVGFMTNWNDVTHLRQNWFQEEVARGISQGVLDYFK